jgi:hypothetical protein
MREPAYPEQTGVLRQPRPNAMADQPEWLARGQAPIAVLSPRMGSTVTGKSVDRSLSFRRASASDGGSALFEAGLGEFRPRPANLDLPSPARNRIGGPASVSGS